MNWAHSRVFSGAPDIMVSQTGSTTRGMVYRLQMVVLLEWGTVKGGERGYNKRHRQTQRKCERDSSLQLSLPEHYYHL